MSSVTQTVNFIRAKGFNPRCFSHLCRKQIYSGRQAVSHRREVAKSGKVLTRVFQLIGEICQFMDSRGKDSTVLQDEKVKLMDEVSAKVFPHAHFAEKLNSLRAEFKRRFSDFEVQKNNLHLFHNPFAIDVETAPMHLQMELIELQCSE
ncbi:hypothetical protein C0Q70_20807 [Pomacea canaliculata]|uniref:Uncharacterized protein n=1 Tax=Pomacea canaliculata TaxID=400727 RepID=A0A2T7NAR6_POMCA|nr:hypothetical protein C0Q70_20807 [Pomacea canaliculata]